MLGVLDASGIELIHPIREGRSPTQIGEKRAFESSLDGGGKRGVLLNQCGVVVAWAWETATVPATLFQPLIKAVEEVMIVLSDTGFHSKDGDPKNLKLGDRGQGNDRMLVETVFSMLTVICLFPKMFHRVWKAFQAQLAFTMALFHVLV